MKWPWDSNRRISAGQLAHALYTEIVDGNGLPPSEVSCKPESAPRFNETLRVYRLGLVIMALVSQEERDKKFVTVRECLEALAFGVQRPEAVDLVGKVRVAMRRLHELLSGVNRGGELSWAMALLSDAGI